jgi:hypothetical protein
VLTKARHWTLSCTSRIQFAPLIPVSLRSIFQVPSLMSFFHCLGPGTRRFETFRNNKNFYGERWLARSPTPSWRTTPCRLSATAYSIYSQLPSVAGGLPSIRNLRTRHAVVTRDQPNMDIYTYIIYKLVACEFYSN